MNMKTLSSFALVLLFCILLGAAKDADRRFYFQQNGFSIAPLEGKFAGETYQVLVMLLPASGGFAPNVNVQVQPFQGTIKEYVDLSRRQFQALNMTVLSEQVTENSILWEYSGSLENRKLHWYARAERADGGKVYLITAAASEPQWNTLAAKLKACVDSFRLEKNAP